MSIRNAKQSQLNAAKQQAAIDEQHAKEAHVRPDALHRAVVFLLKQAALNNPDFAKEATHHLETLDRKLSPVTDELREEVDKGSAISSPLPPTMDAPEGGNPQQEPTELPTDTAEQVRLSSRFGTRGGAARPMRINRPAADAPAKKKK